MLGILADCFSVAARSRLPLRHGSGRFARGSGWLNRWIYGPGPASPAGPHERRKM